MAQILALAPSMSPPMLPVVSRQNTTSTLGFLATLGIGTATTAPTRSKAGRQASRVRRIFQHLQGRGSEGGWRLDDAETTDDCNECVKADTRGLPRPQHLPQQVVLRVAGPEVL